MISKNCISKLLVLSLLLVSIFFIKTYVTALPLENNDIQDISIDKNYVTVDDSINFSLKSSTNSSIQSVSICYKKENSTEAKYLTLDYDSDNTFTGKLYIDENTSCGTWNISWMRIYYNESSTSIKINSSSYDFSSLSFYVKDSSINEDLNNDGVIDLSDLTIIAKNYNITSSSPNWNPKFDFNYDNICDIYDLVYISSHII